MFIFMMAVETFAINVNIDEAQIFIAEDGSEIVYYLDENGMPYQNIDGEKTYIAIGLPSMEVTDESLINELNSQLPSNETDNNMGRAVPTGYVDLSNCANNSNSIEYSINATGLDNDFFNTSPFKYNKHHNAIAIKSSSHKKGLGGDKHLNITYYYYSEQNDKWYFITMMDKDCSVTGGFRFQHSPSLYPYGKFSFMAHNTLKSCTIKIFTTP